MPQANFNLCVVVVIGVAIVTVLGLLACCAMAGKCSREEEKADG